MMTQERMKLTKARVAVQQGLPGGVPLFQQSISLMTKGLVVIKEERRDSWDDLEALPMSHPLPAFSNS